MHARCNIQISRFALAHPNKIRTISC